ncbi:MAG TPA: hypothetical protein VN849_01905 [Stellaceae bacterium]|nr:hypothetical protein [Stellaceae bacterium]
MLVIVVLGGMGTLLGPAIGAFVLVLLQDFISGLTTHWLLPMGLFVIAVVLALPDGIAGLQHALQRNDAKLAADG